jgi:hypothetical protein
MHIEINDIPYVLIGREPIIYPRVKAGKNKEVSDSRW